MGDGIYSQRLHLYWCLCPYCEESVRLDEDGGIVEQDCDCWIDGSDIDDLLYEAREAAAYDGWDDLDD